MTRAERLGRGDRLHEAAPRARAACSGKIGSIGSGSVAERLVEAAVQAAAEPLGERAARGADQLLDPLEAELAQAFDVGAFEPQRGDRQQRDRLAVVARLDRDRPPGGHVPRDRVRAAGGVGDGDLDATGRTRRCGGAGP